MCSEDSQTLEKRMSCLRNTHQNIEFKIRKLQEILAVLRAFLSTPDKLVESEWANPKLSLQVHNLYRLDKPSDPRSFGDDPVKRGLRQLVAKQIACVIKLVGQEPQLIDACEETNLRNSTSNIEKAISSTPKRHRMITIILAYLIVSVTLGAFMEYLIRESGQTVSMLERAALVLATPFLLTWLLIEFLRGSL